MGLMKKAAVLAGLAAAAEGLGTAYFYRRTMDPHQRQAGAQRQDVRH